MFFCSFVVCVCVCIGVLSETVLDTLDFLLAVLRDGLPNKTSGKGIYIPVLQEVYYSAYHHPLVNGPSISKGLPVSCLIVLVCEEKKPPGDIISSKICFCDKACAMFSCTSSVQPPVFLDSSQKKNCFSSPKKCSLSSCTNPSFFSQASSWKLFFSKKIFA